MPRSFPGAPDDDSTLADAARPECRDRRSHTKLEIALLFVSARS
jgi:hypothetical protein